MRNQRMRIYSNLYWKEHCFGLTAASLVDKVRLVHNHIDRVLELSRCLAFRQWSSSSSVAPSVAI
jgi:hypothetical protein